MEIPPQNNDNPKHEKRTRTSDKAPRPEPLREDAAALRAGVVGGIGDAGGGSGCGLDPKQAIRQWLEFAKGAGHVRVAGQRRFDSDLERINTADAEAASLYAFARSRGLRLSESLGTLTRGTPMKAGNEHNAGSSKSPIRENTAGANTHPFNTCNGGACSMNWLPKRQPSSKTAYGAKRASYPSSSAWHTTGARTPKRRKPTHS